MSRWLIKANSSDIYGVQLFDDLSFRWGEIQEYDFINNKTGLRESLAPYRSFPIIEQDNNLYKCRGANILSLNDKQQKIYNAIRNFKSAIFIKTVSGSDSQFTSERPVLLDMTLDFDLIISKKEIGKIDNVLELNDYLAVYIGTQIYVFKQNKFKSSHDDIKYQDTEQYKKELNKEKILYRVVYYNSNGKPVVEKGGFKTEDDASEYIDELMSKNLFYAEKEYYVEPYYKGVY